MTVQSTIRSGRGKRTHPAGEPARSGWRSPVGRWEGRAFGALVLAAFLLYGIGSAQADQPLGQLLVALNSLAVTAVGLIGFRLVRNRSRRVGILYLVARVAEAVLLAGGVALVAVADVGGADTAGYLLAMVVLGLGSIPFCRVLGRGRWLRPWLAHWGVVGYAALVIGALLELTTGRMVTVLFAIPGGLFELALGLHLVHRGFGLGPSSNEPTPGSVEPSGSSQELEEGAATGR